MGEPFGIEHPAVVRDSRASWAAGDANSRGVRLALISLAGGRGAPHARAGAAPVSRSPPPGAGLRLPEQFAASVAGHFGRRQAALIRGRCADLGALSDRADSGVRRDAGQERLISMPHDEAEQLTAGAAELGLSLSNAQAGALRQLLDELAAANTQFNLTAIRDRTGMLRKHVLDSLTLQPYLRGARIADVGTGAGFPGLPLAVVNPGPAVRADRGDWQEGEVRQPGRRG